MMRSSRDRSSAGPNGGPPEERERTCPSSGPAHQYCLELRALGPSGKVLCARLIGLSSVKNRPQWCSVEAADHVLEFPQGGRHLMSMADSVLHLFAERGQVATEHE